MVKDVVNKMILYGCDIETVSHLENPFVGKLIPSDTVCWYYVALIPDIVIFIWSGECGFDAQFNISDLTHR